MAVDLVRLAEVVADYHEQDCLCSDDLGHDHGCAYNNAMEFILRAAPALLAELEAARKVVEAVRARKAALDAFLDAATHVNETGVLPNLGAVADADGPVEAALAAYDALAASGEALSHDAANEGGG